MRRVFHIVFVCLFLFPLWFIRAPRASAQAGDAWEVVSEVNALRASYGLPPYEVDNALMSAAQGHSNYQAEIGTWTHTGPGGSRPHDRAVAAGYGGGAQVYVSENVAMGTELSPHEVVYQVWQDSIHLETMISSNYRHIGAGVAKSGDYVYYTIDVGYIAGVKGEGQPPPSTPPPGGTPPPTIMAMVPIALATPKADGSIIHVVQWGQFLINIAKAYNVPLNEIFALNGLSDKAVIYPGDKLLVKLGTTPTGVSGTKPPLSAGTETNSSTPSPAAKKPTKTPTPTLAVTAVVAAIQGGKSPGDDGSLVQSPMESPGQSTDFLLIAIVILAIVGTALVLIGSTLKRGAKAS